MVTKLENKIDKKTGNFLCHICNGKVGVGVVIKGYVYCGKCGEKIKRGNNDKKVYS